MDEMEEYRLGVERRLSGRRLKNDRRKYGSGQKPKFFDPLIAVIMAIFAAFGILLGTTK